MKPLVSTQQLRRDFHAHCAVEPLDLKLYPGEILGLLGANGAGKSTIMRMLSGDLAVTGGAIEINGINLLRQPLQAKKQLGYLPEQPPLRQDQRVDEYLVDCAMLRRLTPNQIPAALAQAKQRCSLQDMGKRLIGNLSKGYQQRVGLAQAIIHDPRLLILDEPLDGLDPQQINQTQELIRSLAHDCGIIISSHILPHIQAMCSRVLILQDGRKVYSDVITGAASQSYRLVFANKTDIDQIASLKPVEHAEKLDQESCSVKLKSGCSISELAKLLLEQGFALTEMASVGNSLEQIYLAATSGDAV